MQEIFGIKRARRFVMKRTEGEVHLHVDPSSTFQERPLLIVDGDFCGGQMIKVSSDKCHEIVRHTVHGLNRGTPLEGIANSIYADILYPFTDVFCFFSDDIGGFEEVARHLAAWLEYRSTMNLPENIRPRIAIVTEQIPIGKESEREARKAFLWTLEEETRRDPWQQISSIDVIALFPTSSISVAARHRLLKERLMNSSDQVRKGREENRSLFSLANFFFFLERCIEWFVKSKKEPFDFVRASRAIHPVVPDLEAHFSAIIQHITTPEELIQFAAPMIASSLLFDNYIPDTHRKSKITLMLDYKFDAASILSR
ncbi:putative patatin-like phospholipase [Ilyonectria robusta]